MLLHGEIGVGEAYVDGLWDSDDLVALLELGVENRRHVQFSSTWMTPRVAAEERAAASRPAQHG